MRSRSYSSHFHNVVFFFLLSKSIYNTQQAVPKVVKVNFTLTSFYINHLSDFCRMLLLFAAFIGTGRVIPFRRRRSVSFEWTLRYSLTGSHWYAIYEKIILFLYPRSCNNAIVTRQQIIHDQFFFTIGRVLLPETFWWRYANDNGAAFSHVSLHCFFTPQKHVSLCDQRGLLRLLNVPVSWKA